MGEYWVAVNEKKKEYVDPHDLGMGAKLHEQVYSKSGLGTALLLLCSREYGRWLGDPVAVYGDEGSPDLYYTLKERGYTNISDEVSRVVTKYLEDTAFYYRTRT